MNELACALITIGLFALLSWQAHSDWRREQQRAKARETAWIVGVQWDDDDK